MQYSSNRCVLQNLYHKLDLEYGAGHIAPSIYISAVHCSQRPNGPATCELLHGCKPSDSLWKQRAMMALLPMWNDSLKPLTRQMSKVCFVPRDIGTNARRCLPSAIAERLSIYLLATNLVFLVRACAGQLVFGNPCQEMAEGSKLISPSALRTEQVGKGWVISAIRFL
jgi:hypothetical protein